MSSNNKKLVAVIGATGQQGGGVVRALQAGEGFKVRALTRNPDKHRELSEEVVEADLDQPETLKAAFEGAHGVFLVTNFQEAGSDELKQATAAISAAKDAGVKHFIWSTLPNVEAISGGKFNVPHFTGKAKIDRVVKAAGSMGWALPLDPTRRVIHMGDINELGNIVAGAFAHPDEAGNGQYLPLVGDFMSFNEIVETINRQGHNISYYRVPKESFAGSFPGATEIAEMFSYWEAHTYLGSDSSDQIALANKVAGREPTRFSTWAGENFPKQLNATDGALH